MCICYVSYLYGSGRVPLNGMLLHEQISTRNEFSTRPTNRAEFNANCIIMSIFIYKDVFECLILD